MATEDRTVDSRLHTLLAQTRSLIVCRFKIKLIWAQGGLNPWPTGYEPVALPG